MVRNFLQLPFGTFVVAIRNFLQLPFGTFVAAIRNFFVAPFNHFSSRSPRHGLKNADNRDKFDAEKIAP